MAQDKKEPTAYQRMNKPGMAPRYATVAGYTREAIRNEKAGKEKAETTRNKKTTTTSNSGPTPYQRMNPPGAAPRYATVAGYTREAIRQERAAAKQKDEPKPKAASAKGKYDGMSFGAAFNAARGKGDPTFPWTDAKGVTRTYTTQTREEKAAADKKKTTSSNPAAPTAEAPKQRKFRQDKPSGTFTPAKVSMPKMAKKVKKSFSPKSR